MFERDDDPAFAGQMGYSGRRSNDPIDRLPQEGPITAKVHKSELDSEQSEDMFNRLIGFYRRELARQNDNRLQQAIDCDYYDGDQYSADDRQTLLERGQEPLVFNIIATSINWMLGTEKRGRTDYKILPRQKEASKSSERKSQLLKYLSDVNRSEFHISRAFSDCVRAGVGWIEEGVQSDDEGEPIYDRYESWRNMLHDSISTELDLKDARYVFRSKWTDTDIAKDLFPDRKHIIDLAASTSFEMFRALEGTGDDPMDSAEEAYQQGSFEMLSGTSRADRARVRLIEAWFRIPVEDQYMRGGQFAGELFDTGSPGHLREVEAGRATVQRRVRMRTFVAIMTEAGLLYLGKSPYRHNRYPFTPIWCYRRDRDNLPYGVIRQLRDPQSDLNKRASKALYVLSTNKIIMDDGAVEDIDALADEAARPDGIIVKKQGKQLEIVTDTNLAASHLDLMSRSIQMVQQTSGITDENMGRTTNATSGKAIIARQDQGSLATSNIFDNLRFARQVHGEKMLSLTEQFMTDQKQFRITNMRGNPEYVTVNDGMPENDIVLSKADFIISEEDWNSTIRQAQVTELFELMQMLAGTSPQVVLATLDLLVETMDVPQREELVKRIRQITGAEDPDADPENPDPETIARKEAEAAQQELAQRAAIAEVADKEASAAEKQARAAKAQVETSKIQAEVSRILAETAGANVETQVRALEAAAAIMSGKQLAHVADTVLGSSGYQSAAAAPAMASAAPQPQQEGQPQ